MYGNLVPVVAEVEGVVIVTEQVKNSMVVLIKYYRTALYAIADDAVSVMDKEGIMKKRCIK